VAFSVRNPSEEGYATSSPEARECLVTVLNDHSEPLHATLTLDWNDEMLAVEEVNLDPKAIGEVVFALPNLETGVLRARLDHDDALALDNTAWLVIRPPSTMKVLLVSEAESAGAYFLKRVLSLNPRVALSAVTPKEYTPMTQAAFDIVMFDGFSPEQLPGGLLLFVNALPPLEGVASEGTLNNPPIIATDPEHPLMRFLNPSNVTISKALKLALPEGARPLISTRGGALVADVSRGGQQIVVVAFDLADSNWPLRLSFPLFVQNLIAWAPKAALAAESSVAVGDPLTVLPAPDVDTATVTLPDGRRETVKLDPVRAVYFGNTARAGLYEVQYGEKNETHAVNLLDPKESAVTPAEALTIGRSQVAAQRESVRQNRELWHWLVLTAIGVLTLEWWIYSRRAWA